MPVRKGETWGERGPLPDDGVVATTDAAIRRAVEGPRRAREPLPTVGVLGGDLARTLGAPGDEVRLRGASAMTYPVDLGEALLDGRPHVFVAHLVARTRTWGRGVVAMNAQWLGSWNAGPRAHPGDGLLDVYEWQLGAGERLKVRSRLHHGAHLPHPGIREQRRPAAHIDLGRRLPVWLDGEAVGEARTIAVRVEPDALRVVV